METQNNNYLKKIKFLKPVNNVKEGFELSFNTPITILVGDNGCGKSTILDGIRDNYNIEKTGKKPLFKGFLKDKCELDINEEVELVYYDSHSMNSKYSTNFDMDDPLEQIKLQRMSSGQSVVTQLMNLNINEIRNKLVVLDEPCRGLSIKMCNLIMKIILNLQINKNQIIFSTHSSNLMLLSLLDEGELYSVEHMKFMKYKEFLKTQEQL